MLSNTDERKPRPNALCHDASGSRSTGIIDAMVTSERRKIVPFRVSGSSDHSGVRNGAVSRSAAQMDAPITGK